MNSIEDKKQASNLNVIQNLILESRQKLSVSGVLDVLSFDDQLVIIETELGLLNVKGDNLRINKLSIDSSEIIVEGNVGSMMYSDKNFSNKNESFIGKIFK